MVSQTIGLAYKLSSNVVQLKTNLIFPWSKLQPGLLPIFNWIFKNDFDFTSKPKVLISCGRKSVYASLFLKKIFKKQIITIHIQNPKVNSNNFDFVIVPNHDNFDGNNVIKSSGAIHKFTKKIINGCKDVINISNKTNLVSVIIGGSNQHYKFSTKEICELISRIKNLKLKYKNYSFCIIPSRRTNEYSLELLIKELGEFAFVWDKRTYNPYLFALKYSQYFILTSDSTSMISECAFTGKPLYIYHLPFKRISNRILNFHNEFEENNITRKLSNTLNIWKYTHLNEAERIAGILRTRILNKYTK
jgi:mitochondrial fission protein ELM1